MENFFAIIKHITNKCIIVTLFEGNMAEGNMGVDIC